MLSSILVAALLLGLLVAPPADAAETGRVVAIGDIHGSYDGFTKILLAAGLIDAENRWAGGRSTLVQTGDFTDRGDGVRAVMDLLMSLQKEARKAKGEVIVLMGNHEMWSLMQNNTDIIFNPAIYASFSDSGSEARRQEAFEAWKKWRKAQPAPSEEPATVAESGLQNPMIEDPAAPEAPTTPQQSVSPRSFEQEQADWLARHPPGFVEYHEAMAPDGEYGRWIRKSKVMTKVAGTVFLHGGISERWSILGIDDVNRVHMQEIASHDQARRALVKAGIILPFFTWGETVEAVNREIASPRNSRSLAIARESLDRLGRFLGLTGTEDAPLWFRGFAMPPHGLPDAALVPLREALTSIHGAEHFVSAHSPFNGGDILVRLDGAFFLIDTGMLSTAYPGGRPSALEFSDGKFFAIYENERKLLLPADMAAAP
ncbi:MAG: metallophosphoesterase [Acidobacteriota bacterium]|nr:metallophosphoesterase [Acidobacteriota bacterium]